MNSVQRKEVVPMTIMDISRSDKSYRALLSEQYADVTNLFKYILDMFATEHESFKTIKITDITVKEHDVEEEKDLGYTTVKTKQTGRTMALDFASLLEHGLLPSSVMTDDMTQKLEFAGISFDHGECVNPVEVLFDFEKRSKDGKIEHPAIIVIRLVEDDCEASAEDMFFMIGYVQYVISAAESAAAIDEYLKDHPQATE